MTTSETVEALYVHIPFCRSLCGYCDFYSIIPPQDLVSPLVDALLLELEQYQRQLKLNLKTVFIGGGTPTSMPVAELQRLIAAIRRLPVAGESLEFTVEANPATVSDEMATMLAEQSVNRASIGAQSFQPNELAVLERIHGPDEIRETVDRCRNHGIEQISLDLIFAIPGQSSVAWQNNLRAALNINPDHLSCYSLTYERGTRLYDSLMSGTIERVDPDLDASMYDTAIEILTEAGYEHYEISNFARPGRHCRHNLTYWRNEPYLGIGPAAAGYLNCVRYKNLENVKGYINRIRAGQSPRDEEELRNLEGQMRDTAMLSLRTMDGLDRRLFIQRFETDPAAFFQRAIELNLSRGLIELSDNHIRLTTAGIFLADRVIADFL